MPGPVRARVAQLTVTHELGGRRLGSGYLVADGVVLTAGHVLDGASAVLATFEPDQPGQRWGEAISWWADRDTDIGMVGIAPWTVGAGGEPLSPANFGRLPDSAEVVEVVAVGFPRWKMRNADGTVPVDGDGKKRFRESAHIVGISPLQSNARRRALEVVLTAPPAESADGHSPWRVCRGRPCGRVSTLSGSSHSTIRRRGWPGWPRYAWMARWAGWRRTGRPSSGCRSRRTLCPRCSRPSVLGTTTARPDLEAALREHVRPAPDGQVNEVVSIEGAGGFGKTTLAAILWSRDDSPAVCCG